MTQSREYNEALDGDLEQDHPAEPNVWRGAKSGLLFWEDEGRGLSLSHNTFNEAQTELKAYAKYILGA